MIVQQVPPRDLLVDDGEALALVADSLVRLSGLGLLIWQAARKAISIGELIAACETELGPAPDGPTSSVVREAVDSLCAAGLLRRIVPAELPNG